MQAIRTAQPSRVRFPDASVLIVAEDDAGLRRMSTNLQVLVGSVVEADTARAALDQLRTQQIRVVFVDLDLPSNDGITLLQCIRSLPETRHIPAVVIVPSDNPWLLNRALEAGATSHLPKPLNWSMFESHVHHLLRISHGKQMTERLLEEASEIVERTLQTAMSGDVAGTPNCAAGAMTIVDQSLSSNTLPDHVSGAMRELRQALEEQQTAVARLGQIIRELEGAAPLSH